MRENFKVLGGLLAAFQSASAVALPPTDVGSLDPTFGEQGVRLFEFIPGSTNESILSISPSGEDYLVAGYGMMGSTPTGFVGRIRSDGARDPTWGTNGAIMRNGVRFTGARVFNNRVVAAGASGNNAIVAILDGNGQAIGGCGDGNGILSFPPRTLDSAFINSIVTPLDGNSNVAYFAYAEGNAAQDSFRGGILAVNYQTCALDAGWGNAGRSMAAGDFIPRDGFAVPDGVAVLGNTRSSVASNLAVGAYVANRQGIASACGSTVKQVHSNSATHTLMTALGYDPRAHRLYVAGYQPATGAPFLHRFMPSNCALDSTTWSFGNANGYPAAVGIGQPFNVNTTSESVVVAFNTNQSKSFLRWFAPSGGAPALDSDDVTSANVTHPPGVDSEHPIARKAGSLTTASTTSLMIQPDGKIVIGGTGNPGGGSSLVARYIGVERTGNVIEFYNTILNHYFITADPIEAAAIDNGSAGPGWQRTGQTWKSGGPDRVCRFYGSTDIDPATGQRRGPNSHFYTISSAECAQVKLDLGWRFESYDFSGWRGVNASTCPAGTTPVKRVYNNRFAQNDSNHRYMISDTIYNQMVAQGWSGEGIVFCSVL